MSKVAAAQVAEELTTMRKEVVADKLRERQDQEYVEKGRPYLGFSNRGNKVVVTGDSVRMQKLKAHPEALEMIKSFFMGDDENVEIKFEKDEETYIPPFFCPVGDIANGYSKKNVERFLVVLLNILDSGKIGGSKIQNKERNPIPPPWFTNKVGYLNWNNPSYSTMDDNLDIIKGIFEYFNLDINTHCKNLPTQEEEEEEEEYVREEAALDEAVIEDAAWEDVALAEASREEVGMEEVGMEEASMEEVTREEPTMEEAAREEATRAEASREEAGMEEASIEEASREEAGRKDATRKEDTREEAARGEATMEEATREGANTEDKQVVFKVAVENVSLQDDIQDAAFQDGDIERAIFEVEGSFLEDIMERVVVEKVVNKEAALTNKRKINTSCEEGNLLPSLSSFQKHSSPPGPPGPPGPKASLLGPMGPQLSPPQVTSQLRKKSKRSKQKEKNPDFIWD